MDKAKSLLLQEELINKSVNGYEVIELLNNGKSAAVFKARKNYNDYALKIFDNELVERFGHEIQIKRIKQEIGLKNHTINNLVKIYEGGQTIVEGNTYYFIVMELISGINLKDYINTNTYNQDFVLKVLWTLNNTTSQLLQEKNIVHRDIKPENMMIDDDGEIILMDLGVLKFVGARSFSDNEEKSFVGTLRYAAPEFLIREEIDSIDGWTSLNLYQIGATLHDMIMKAELFNDKVPYTNLVIAIMYDIPVISNFDYSYNLQQLVRDMLIKDWKKRIELVNYDRILKVCSKELTQTSYQNSVDEIFKNRLKFEASYDEIEKLKKSEKELINKRDKIGEELKTIIYKIFKNIGKSGICTSISEYDSFLFSNDYNKSNECIQNFSFKLYGDLKMGFPKEVNILVRVISNTDNYVEISCLGMIIPDNWTGIHIPVVNQYFSLDKESRLLKNSIDRFGPPIINFSFDTKSIFKGVPEFDDTFSEQISVGILDVISKMLEKVGSVVESRLEEQKKSLGSNIYFYEDASRIKETIIVNS